MRCPKCKGNNCKCVDSRPLPDGRRRRRYECKACGVRFNTKESWVKEEAEEK